MAFSLANKKLNIDVLGGLVPNIGSTSEHNIVGTATATSTSRSQTFRWELGDFTSTQAVPTTTQIRAGGIGDFGIDHQYYRALVNFKSLSGNASATSTSAYGLVVNLVAATSTASFVSDLGLADAYVIDSKVIMQTSATSTGVTQSVILFGAVPNALGARYARVEFTRVNAAGQTSPSSTALDVIIEGVG